jgi:GMP synthase-like glutamine amidotransferase
MRVLAFRHVPFEHLGLIAETLEERGISFEYQDLYQSGVVPSLDGVAGLIFMGGPMSVNDDLPYISQELDLVRLAVARNIPVLGVCLGSQLIAKALGGSVYPNPVKEIGWFPVEFYGAVRDPLFAGLTGSEVVFHWHGETFDLPPGAALLASSDACRHQAFRVRNNVYGLQFHLEVTPEMIADWCGQDANCGDLREIEQPIDPNYNSARLRQLAGAVFARWCDLLPALPTTENELPTTR